MSYQLPNINTPWASTDEMVAAMAERDHLGQKRYGKDPAFTAAVELKSELGFAVGGIQTTAHDSGTQHYQSGLVQDLQAPELFVTGEGAHEMIRQRNALQAELEEHDARTAQSVFLQQIHLRHRERISVADTVKPFATLNDQVAAQGSWEYRNLPHVRTHIEARIAASDFSSKPE